MDKRIKFFKFIDSQGNEQTGVEYRFPIDICILTENTELNLYSSSSLNPTTYIFKFSKNNIFNYCAGLKKIVYLYYFTLYDIFSWDLSKKDDPLTNTNTCLVLQSQLTDVRLMGVYNLKKVNEKKKPTFYTGEKLKIHSISAIYSGATWLERENSEMFYIFYKKLKDTRRLMTDYTDYRGILLKNSLFIENFNNIKKSYYFKSYYGTLTV